MNAASGDPETLQALADALEHGAATTEAGAQSVRAALVAVARARTFAPADHDALRRIALFAVDFDVAAARELAVAYGALCAAEWAAPVPLPWPRRTAGDRLRVITLHSPAAALDAATLAALASLPRESFAITMASIGNATLPAGDGTASLVLPAQPDAATAKAIGGGDFDVLIDLAGLAAATGPLLAQRPARMIWTVAMLPLPNAAPLVDRVIDDANGLVMALMAAHASLDPRNDCVLDPKEMAAAWIEAVQAHQRGDLRLSLQRYARVLELQPGYAPAEYLRGIVASDAGDGETARAAFAAALAHAPDYVEARLAAARAASAAGEFGAAVALCEEGLAQARGDARLWREAGLAQLARQDGSAAAEAFRHALALEGNHGETHYNYGVALQMRGDFDEAARAYHVALSCQPDLVAAQFNLGVLFQEQGATDAAVAAFSAVLEAESRNVAAYKNLGEVLHGAGRVREWMENFRRFEAACPKALSLAVHALDVCQYRGDFTALERYLGGLAQGQFEASDEAELVDGLEELLYLLLFFDVHPETMRQFAVTFDAAARRVYGVPLGPVATRAPGRLRVGYLSADLRNHVMGKMMWSALRHHDKGRFELFFYSLSTESDEWTEKFRGLADRFETIAGLPEHAAAQRIAADDLDLLVDLSTHTKGARPGILALKPARVQITHVASAGTVGLAAIDFKLTDRYADVPGNQTFQLETLLPMDGCVYPCRHVAPASAHPFRRDAFGVGPESVVIGAFVHWRKLSRRCLALWRDVLTRIPRAKLAFSPLDPAAREPYLRLAAAAGIAADRLLFLPQGRDDAESQGRYEIIDFVLDPMPFGGVNGTLEALDMAVPVVTLCGRRHGERSTYSILANLGVTQTVAASGPQYVDLAARLADDAAFAAEVKAAIRAGLARSALTDMVRHARALEAAYEAALAQKAPEALAAAHYALAEELDDEGDKAAALASLRRALVLHPALAPAHRFLGILLAECGNYAMAVESFERAIELEPGNARVWCNLGTAQRTLGRHTDAESAFRRALALQPDYPLAAYNLANVLRDLGRIGEAEAMLRQSIACHPADKPFAPALIALAALLRQRGALDEAAAWYGRAIKLASADSTAEYVGLADVLAERGDIDEARAAYAHVMRRRPADLRSALAFHLTLPMVYRDAAELRAVRARYTEGLAELESGLDRFTGTVAAEQLLEGLQWSNFFLAYQGEDDRELQARYAAFAARAIDRVNPAWRAPIALRDISGRRIRIGFASAFLHFGTVGQYFHSWITGLDRQAFEVFYYQLRPADDPVIGTIRTRADQYRLCAGMNARPSRVASVIRSDALDVLVYPELGMDATSFALAALRLAPRQYSGWGHPVTTGHATIDGFFTCDVMEPPDGAAHYAERLVRLPGIGTAYPRTTLPTSASRAAFALPSGVPLLLCPQSMFKIHPDNDEVLARVVARSPGAILLLFAEGHPATTDRFMRRLSASFERHGLSIRERTRVLPRVSHEDYLRINLVCDLMLDTLHWSGGNTSLDALACGLPMVTLPGRFMRGRQSAGMLRLIGVPELIASDEDDYVRIAVQLAGDAERRGALRKTIRGRAERIFEDPAPLSALQAFLQEAVVPRD